MKTVCLLFVVLCVASVFALDCQDCDRKSCKAVECKFGVTTDPCGCCPACYKGDHDVCGGPWNIFGVCHPRLFVCVKPRSPDGKLDPVHEFNAKGKCVPLAH